MSPDSALRMAMLAIMATSVVIGIYFRWQSSTSGERLSYRPEGCLFAIVLRTAGAGLWLATLVYLLAPAALQWTALDLPIWPRWLGIATGSLGTLLMYWTLSSLGKNLTDTVVTREHATLVTSGPYRWVRHPFYVTAALLMISITIASANWLIGLLSIVVLSLLALRTPKEEQMLIARFGEDYRDYMRRTGKFVPRLPGRR